MFTHNKFYYNNMLFKGKVYERKIVIDSLACYDEHFAIMM